jgi:hypothetical protein
MALERRRLWTQGVFHRVVLQEREEFIDCAPGTPLRVRTRCVPLDGATMVENTNLGLTQILYDSSFDAHPESLHGRQIRSKRNALQPGKANRGGRRASGPGAAFGARLRKLKKMLNYKNRWR